MKKKLKVIGLLSLAIALTVKVAPAVNFGSGDPPPVCPPACGK
jgi:hypothetical protein